MRKTAVLGFGVLIACGGGGSPEEPDANPPDAMIEIDAPPAEVLDVTLGGVVICPDGWTTRLEAKDEELQARVIVQASCSAAVNEVEMIFKPRPTGPGATAPCNQTTFQIDGGKLAICIIGSAVRLEPTGQLTLSESSPPRISGSCGCTANDDETAVAVATFDLTLQ